MEWNKNGINRKCCGDTSHMHHQEPQYERRRVKFCSKFTAQENPFSSHFYRQIIALKYVLGNKCAMQCNQKDTFKCCYGLYVVKVKFNHVAWFLYEKVHAIAADWPVSKHFFLNRLNVIVIAWLIGNKH